MRKELGRKPLIFPQPVLIIGTSADESVLTDGKAFSAGKAMIK